MQTISLITLIVLAAGAVSATETTDSVCAQGCVLAGLKKAETLKISDVCANNDIGSSFDDCVKGEKCEDASSLSGKWGDACRTARIAKGLEKPQETKATEDSPTPSAPVQSVGDNNSGGNNNGGDKPQEQAKSNSGYTVAANTFISVALSFGIIAANL